MSVCFPLVVCLPMAIAETVVRRIIGVDPVSMRIREIAAYLLTATPLPGSRDGIST